MKQEIEQSEELVIYPRISLKDFMDSVHYMISDITFNGGLEEDIYVTIEQEGTVLSFNCNRLETDDEVLAREEREIKRKEERRLQYEKLRKEFEG